MDKYEYRLKTDHIKQVAARKDYEGAARLCDSIDWNKVKDVKMLMTVTEIYATVHRYQEAIDALIQAYQYAPIGRRIVYRLTELALEAGKFEEAKEYYDEFCRIAPKDRGKFILLYKMACSQHAQLSEKIRILEAYKKQEFDEKWSYELASLYAGNGQIEECVQLCDDIILWFGLGKYVEKALGLKAKYASLTAEQQAKAKEIQSQKDRKLYEQRSYEIEKIQGVPDTVRDLQVDSELDAVGRVTAAAVRSIEKEAAERQQTAYEEICKKAQEVYVEQIEDVSESSINCVTEAVEAAQMEEQEIQWETVLVETSSPKSSAVVSETVSEEPEQMQEEEIQNAEQQSEELEFGEAELLSEEIELETSVLDSKVQSQEIVPEELRLEEIELSSEEFEPEEIEMQLDDPMPEEVTKSLEESQQYFDEAEEVKSQEQKSKQPEQEKAVSEEDKRAVIAEDLKWKSFGTDIVETEELPSEELEWGGVLAQENDWEAETVEESEDTKSENTESESIVSENGELEEDEAIEDTWQEDEVSEDILDEDEVPEDILDEDIVPEDILNEDEVPEDILNEDIVPEDILNEDEVPKDILEEEEVFEGILEEDDPIAFRSEDIADIDVIGNLDRHGEELPRVEGVLEATGFEYVEAEEETKKGLKKEKNNSSEKGKKISDKKIQVDNWPRMNPRDLSRVWHFAVNLTADEDPTELACEFLRKVEAQSELAIPEMASRVTGYMLNRKNLVDSFDRMLKKVIIVVDAGVMEERVIEELCTVLEPNDRSMLMILVDKPATLARMFEQHPKLGSIFTAQFMETGYNIEDLIEHAKEYADRLDCVLDGSAELFLLERLEQLLENSQKDGKRLVEEVIRNAMHEAEKRSFSRSVRNLFTIRYDKEGRLILREIHFLP